MATQSANLSSVFNQIGIDYKALKAQIGSNTLLATSDKTSIVNAINEVKGAIDTVANAQAGSSSINDATVATTSTWSSSQISAKLQEFKESVLGGASAAFDTLQEIEAMFNSDASYAAKVADALAKRVRVDAAQTFTVDEQKQACANIGIGDPTIDYVAIYNTAKG